MNERLQQLMLKAGYAAPHLAARANKLAELIIRECATVVSKVPPGYKDYRDQIEEAMRDDCVAAMLKHFGIDK